MQFLLTGLITKKKLVYCLKVKLQLLLREQPVKFRAGELVTFPAGMDCGWEIHQAIRKYYRFGD